MKKDIKIAPKKLSPIKEEKSASPKQKSPSLRRSNSSERTLYKSESPKQKSPSPKPKKSILKKPSDEKKPKKKLLFNDFIQKADAHSKDYYDRRGVPKMAVTKENIFALKKELNELMDSLYIHPESKKHTKRF